MHFDALWRKPPVGHRAPPCNRPPPLIPGRVVSQCTAGLPAGKPRYVMGIGYPLDIVICSGRAPGPALFVGLAASPGRRLHLTCRLVAWRCPLAGIGLRLQLLVHELITAPCVLHACASCAAALHAHAHAHQRLIGRVPGL